MTGGVLSRGIRAMLLPLVLVACCSASGAAFARDENEATIKALGLTFGADGNLSRDARAVNVAVDYAEKFEQPGWYGRGWFVQAEYDREQDFDAGQRTETLNLYAGVIYDITDRTDFAIGLGQGVRERVSNQGGWKKGGSTLLNAALGREFKSPFGINAVALTTNYDLDESEWAVGASLSFFFGL